MLAWKQLAETVALVVLAIWTTSCGSTQHVERPNILLILADDLGLTEVGFMGGEIPTPNLDSLASDGVRLTNFHAAPACMWARAMLMSGTTTREAGVIGHNDALRPDVASLPERLRAAGYHTYMAGKWNLGLDAEDGPLARGFESSYALMPSGDNHLGASLFVGVDAVQENGEPAELPSDWYSTELLTDKLMQYIDANRGDGVPWFGYLALTAPHWPLQVPDDWIDRHAGRYDQGYDVVRAARLEKARELGVIPHGVTSIGFRGKATPWDELDEDERAVSSRAMEIFAAMVENMDMHVGRIVQYLEKSNQLQNTVIVFTSDNGASGADIRLANELRAGLTVPYDISVEAADNSFDNMGRANSWISYGRGWAEAAMAPYRNVKASLHSGGTIAPTLVYFPPLANKGRLVASYLTIMDLLPTFLETAGESAPKTSFQGRTVLPVRGRSFWADIKGQGVPARTTPWWTASDRMALVRLPWKIISEPQGTPDAEDVKWRLFNLEVDPGEQTDVSQEHPELKSELVGLWEDYAEEVTGAEP